ncbi:MAG: YqgE/AlgH family protein [Proteobacteria bacterium]|nr:YqgE/AlgH family protein [Pseudomonadota bacterium]
MEDNFENKEFESLKGHFLIAMPDLGDPNFSKTVTLICEHNDDGALGLIINRPHPLIITEQIFREFKMGVGEGGGKEPIYMGGPVQMDEVYILHGPPFDWRGTLQITRTLALSNTIDLLEAMALNMGPKRTRMMLGCAGWGPGQLEKEIRQNAWLTQSVSDGIIFNTRAEDCWDEAVRSLGVDPLLLTSRAGHA